MKIFATEIELRCLSLSFKICNRYEYMILVKDEIEERVVYDYYDNNK